MASLLNIGVNGLKAQQAALNVTGQNITNASTPGYSRQRADLVAQSGGISVDTFSGAGARVDKITRIADQFIGNQIRIDQALSSELDTFSTRIGQLEGSLFDDGSGLDSALQDFFDALNNASSNPSDSAARQFVLSRGESLAQRFQGVAERINQQSTDIVSSLDAAAKQVNDLASLIADSNVRIANAQSDPASGSANQLLDQRDGLLKDLASLVSVTTSEQADGQVNVFIGKGQTLVLGAQAAQLDISSQGAVMLAAVGNSVSQNITSAISGGEMGGLLSYASQVLEPAQNEIGYMAASIAVAFNQQHSLGIDANGEFGQNFFSDINNPNLVGQRIVAFDNGNGSLATATVNVFIDDPLSFDPSDYEFRVAENGSFTIERSIDGEMVFQGASLTTPQTVEFDGLRVEFAAGDFQPGQTIRIRPYASIGTEMSVALSDVSNLALSSPVLIEAGVANQGSAVMTVGAITDSMNGMFGDDQSLVPPLLVRFVNDVQYEVLDNSNPGNPQPLNPDLGLQTYIPGIQNSVLPYAQGSTVAHSSGPAVAALAAASLVSDLSPSNNNYPSGSVQITTLDPITGEVLSQPTVAIAAGSSARAIAQQISTLAGASASARTSLEISNLVDYDSGVPVELSVNGQLITGFSSLDELADAINANSTLQGQSVVALSDGQTLTLIAQQGDDLNLHFQGDPNESIEVTSSSGQSLTLNGNLAGNYRHVTVAGEITTLLNPLAQMTTQLDGLFAANPVHTSSAFGFDLVMSGNVQAGDEYTIGFNSQGVGDNRNALALSLLAEERIVGDPPKTFAGVFAGLVQEIGAAASQVSVNQQAAAALLVQSESYRESVSGVNLDEEAANLIRYEQAYNASAQVISVARDMFNVLLRSVS